MQKIISSSIIRPVTVTILSLMVLSMAIITGLAHLETFLGQFNSNLLDGSLTLEEDIALILIAYGVLLEERGLFSHKAYGENLPVREENLNELSEGYGAYLLMLGLFMELNDQAFEPLIMKLGLEQIGLGLMLALDGAAILLTSIFIWRIWTVKDES